VILRTIGRLFISTGVLILLFLAYQLFGTNVITDRHQQALAAEFEALPTSAPSKPDIGDGMALIEIPKIEVKQVVVEGVEVEDLKKGPGHYPTTSLPGEQGNVVISGHRTTYGAPFYRLDELKVGDEIRLSDRETTYVYRVTETKIVRPGDLTVVVPTEDARLTLATCNPRFSARQRLIVVAALEDSPDQGKIQ